MVVQFSHFIIIAEMTVLKLVCLYVVHMCVVHVCVQVHRVMCTPLS